MQRSYALTELPATHNRQPILLQAMANPLQERLLQLEQQITNHTADLLHADWLNEYLDLGLDLASQAGERQLKPLQTSWIRRLYQTLRQATLNPQANRHWRDQCFDYLYQPYFVLQQLYLSSPAQQQHLRGLIHEFKAISRHFSR